MGLFNPWRFCAHACLGPSMCDKIRTSVGSNDGAIVGLNLKGDLGTGTGILIHRMLVLTTHGTLPSIAEALDTDLWIKNNIEDSENNRKRLAPERFFITNQALDITVVACDWLNTENFQPVCLDNANDPCLDYGRRVYLLGRHQNQEQKDLMVGDGRITVETQTLIEFSADGAIWSPGSAGFNIWGNLAFMICDPEKHLVAEMASRRRKVFTWRKNKPKQFGINVFVVQKWLKENWTASIEELEKPRIPSKLEVKSQKEDNSESFMNSAEPVEICKPKVQEQEISCILNCKEQLDPSASEAKDIINRIENKQDLRVFSIIPAHQRQPGKQHLDNSRTVPTQQPRNKEEFTDEPSSIPEHKRIPQEDFMDITSDIPAQVNKQKDPNIFPAQHWRSQDEFIDRSSTIPTQSNKQQCVVSVIEAEEKSIRWNRQTVGRSSTSSLQSEPELEVLERSCTTARHWEFQAVEEQSVQCSGKSSMSSQEKSNLIPAELSNKPDLKGSALTGSNKQNVDRSSSPAREREAQLDNTDRLNTDTKQWVFQEDQKQNEDENYFLTSDSFAAELRRLQEEQFQDQSGNISRQIQKPQKMECCSISLRINEAQRERAESSILTIQIKEPGSEDFNLKISSRCKEFQSQKEHNVNECIIPEQFVESQTLISHSSTFEAPLNESVQELHRPRSPSTKSEEDDFNTAEHFTDQYSIASPQNKKPQWEEGFDVQRSGTLPQSMKPGFEEFIISANCKGLPKEKEQKPHGINKHAEQNGVPRELHGSKISALQNESHKVKDLERSMIFAQFMEFEHLEEKPTQKQFSGNQEPLQKPCEYEVVEEVEDEVEEVLEIKAKDKFDNAQNMPEAAAAQLGANVKKQEHVTEQRAEENDATYTRIDISAENLDPYSMKKQKNLAEKTETSTSHHSESPQMEAPRVPEDSDPSIRDDKPPCRESTPHNQENNSSPKEESCHPVTGFPAIPEARDVKVNYASEDCSSKVSTDSDTEILNKENQMNQMGPLSQASSSRDPETSDPETTCPVEAKECVNSSPKERHPRKTLQQSHSHSSRGAANSVQPKARSILKLCNSQVHPASVRSLRGHISTSTVRISADGFVPTVSSRMKNRNLDETNVKKNAVLRMS